MLAFYIFAGLCMICVLLFIYPYVFYPFLAKKLKGRPVAAGCDGAGDGANFTLVFCAFNEARSMPEKLENVRALKARYPGMEFMAFDDGSSDGTPALIEAGAPFLRLVRGGGRNGKAHGMKRLAAEARGRFMIFTDANVILDLDAPDALARLYADPEVGGICGALHYTADEGTSTAAIGGFYWRLEEKIKDRESASGNVMGADGSIFSTRRALYPDFPDTVLDDFTVSMSVVFAGKRLIKSNDVKAYEKLVSARSDEFARKIRISARAYHTHRVLKGQLSRLSAIDKFKYVSHKLLRWFGGVFLILGACFGLVACALLSPYFALAALALMSTVFLVGMKRPDGKASSIVEIILAIIATLIGTIKAARGQTFSVWKPANSR